MRGKTEFASRTYDLSRNQVPLFLRAAAVRDPKLRADIISLPKNGINSITIKRRQKTPHDIRSLLHESDHRLLDKALREPTKKEGKEVKPIRQFVDTSIQVAAAGPNEDQLEILERINAGIRPAKEGYALRRLSYDRPAGELKALSYIGAGSAVAAGVATGLELTGVKGWGLLAAQSADDVGNAAITALTEKRKKKTHLQKFWEIAKENWPVGPVLVAAGIADNTIIPPLLESPNVGVRMVGGLLFTAAAVGGSVCVNILQSRRRGQKLKEQPEGTIMIKQHPFNTALWFGVGFSTIASVAAASKGMLLDHYYSGTLQTVIGQLETLTAFAGLYAANGISNVKEHASDWLTLKRAKKSEQIVFEKK